MMILVKAFLLEILLPVSEVGNSALLKFHRAELEILVRKVRNTDVETFVG